MTSPPGPEAFYGLSGRPFSLSPDPAFFFASKVHMRVLAYLEYGVHKAEGFIVVTGEVGAGKTTLVRKLFGGLDPAKVVGAQLVSTQLDGEDTLRMVMGAFGLPATTKSKAVLLMRFEGFLKSCREQGKRVLLVVDEAQNLGYRALEELRMLSNFQSADRSLFQTFLVGQPEFRATMFGERMSQLRQRVIAACHLPALDLSDTRAYIEHRLHTVGGKGDPSFGDDALEEIHAFTGGVPRRINTLCDRLMVLGFIEEKHAFGRSEVREVINEIQLEFGGSEVRDVTTGMQLEMPASVPLSARTPFESVLPSLPDIDLAPVPDEIPAATGEASERSESGGT